MTIKEYISASLGDLLSPSKVDLLILKSELNATSEASDITVLDTAIYENLPLIIPFQNSISEGGVSLTYDIEAIKLWYSLLSKKLGKEDTLLSIKSSITDITNKW